MSCVIFGAGKIARGFVGHLLFLSNIEFTFVEKVDTLADLINERGQYTVNILGDASKNTLVTGAKALKFSQIDEISKINPNGTNTFATDTTATVASIVPLTESMKQSLTK